MVVITEVAWTKKFERELRKLRDKTVKDRVKEQIEKILDNSETGKLLRFALKGERSVYVPPYRLMYAVQGATLYLLRCQNRILHDARWRRSSQRKQIRVCAPLGREVVFLIGENDLS